MTTDRVPPVSCRGCGRSWFSASLLEGLRILGLCPRCGGELLFRDDATPVHGAGPAARDVAPHLVLGIPRR